MAADEGPIQTVGWGRFALPGERKRLREKEAARMKEIKGVLEGTRVVEPFETTSDGNRQTSGDASYGAVQASNGDGFMEEEYPPGFTSPEGDPVISSASQPDSGITSAETTTGNKLVTRWVSISQLSEELHWPEVNLDFELELPADSWESWHAVIQGIYAKLDSLPREVHSVSGESAEAFLLRAKGAAPELTRRERDVLRVLCRPLFNGQVFTEPASLQEVSAALQITEAAVQQHLLRLYDKFGISAGTSGRRAQLANEAIRRGAITLADLRS
jgi:hypothetical protein